MGAFDTYRCKPEHAVLCPGCNTSLHTFQTHALDRLMKTFFEGQEFRQWETIIEIGFFKATAYCACGGHVDVKVPITEGIFGAPEIVSYRRIRRPRKGEGPRPKPEIPSASHLRGIRFELDSAMRTIREGKVADVESFLSEIRSMIDHWLEQASKKS